MTRSSSVSASGDVYLGSNKSDISQIADKVRDLISGKLDKTVYVKSDGRAKYGDVVKVVDEIRSAGVDNVGLETEKTDQEILRAPPPPADKLPLESGALGLRFPAPVCKRFRPD